MGIKIVQMNFKFEEEAIVFSSHSL